MTKAFHELSEPIDAVITWVDGSCPLHQQKLNAYLAQQGILADKAAAPTRFHSCGEIDYCVESLLRFAPWIRTIFIVTDAQTPSVINRLADKLPAGKLQLVDHSVIFSGFEHCLPTFNSLSIESVLWRIPGLSERFIYLNDDCALIRPISPNDFFRDNQLILRGKWKVQTDKKWLTILKKYSNALLNTQFNVVEDNQHRTLQETTAKLAGWQRHFFHLPHAPFALHKQTLADFFHRYPNVLSQNIRYPLRHLEQFWTVSLAQHLHLNHHTMTIDNKLKAAYLHGGNHSQNKIQLRLAAADKHHNIAFICLQSMDMAPKKVQAMIFEWLDKRIRAS